MNNLEKLEKYLEKSTVEMRKNMNEMHVYWLICIVCGFFVFEISSIINSHFMTSDDGGKYLLSAISQALAAVFTLVFTVSLMVATMAGKYDAIDKIFNRSTISLMALFTTGIILPILLLNIDSNSTDKYGFFVSLSTGLAAFCIIAVIPYLKSLNNTLKFDIGVSNLISELHESIATQNYTRASTAIYDLAYMGESAIENKRRRLAITISDEISKSMNSVVSRHGSLLFLQNSTTYAFSQMGEKAVYAQMDWIAAISLQNLKNICLSLISNGVKDSSAEDIILNIHKIGLLAIKHKLVLTSIVSLECLLDSVRETPPEDDWKDLLEKAYNYFGICAANFEKYYPEEADTMCDKIKSNCIDINQILPEETKDRINRYYPTLDGYIDKLVMTL